MNKVFIILLFFSSCSPLIRSKIISTQNPLNKHATVLVLKPFDTQIIKGIKIGTINSKDNGFSINCGYNEIIKQLKSIAREKGANLIKITKQKKPNYWSTCERVETEIYYVSNIEKYQKEIEWNVNRNLKWTDFKALVKPKNIDLPNASAVTCSNFGFEAQKLFYSSKTEIDIISIFDCTKSWVDSTQTKNNWLLKHEQGHFDLTEIYARKLRKNLENGNFNTKNLNSKTRAIFEKIEQEYKDEQKRYDKETNHSLKKNKQIEWNSYFDLILRQNN